MYYLGSCK
jgi:hypothetical protein